MKKRPMKTCIVIGVALTAIVAAIVAYVLSPAGHDRSYWTSKECSPEELAIRIRDFWKAGDPAFWIAKGSTQQVAENEAQFFREAYQLIDVGFTPAQAEDYLSSQTTAYFSYSGPGADYAKYLQTQSRANEMHRWMQAKLTGSGMSPIEADAYLRARVNALCACALPGDEAPACGTTAGSIISDASGSGVLRSSGSVAALAESRLPSSNPSNRCKRFPADVGCRVDCCEMKNFRRRVNSDMIESFRFGERD